MHFTPTAVADPLPGDGDPAVVFNEGQGEILLPTGAFGHILVTTT